MSQNEFTLLKHGRINFCSAHHELTSVKYWATQNFTLRRRSDTGETAASELPSNTTKETCKDNYLMLTHALSEFAAQGVTKDCS